ncbi:MAG TPA: M48 family metallopeptidase [Terriglobia bacterium]|nr:M48 family metallopeptidase [Terriglobia bacterium]
MLASAICPGPAANHLLPTAYSQSSATTGAAGAEAAPQHYTLTPAQRTRAEAYARTRYVVYFVDTLLALVIYLLFWLSRFGVALRNLARRVSCRLIVKCLIFAPLFIVAFSVLILPLDYYSGYRIERQFGLSTQTVASWFADWGKGLGLSIIAAVVLMWVFYGVVRRGPRRWWLYFWLATIPLELFVVFIEPWVVEPLFYKFTPLAETQPALTERIEDMMSRAGLQIPPSRIFEMNASSKTKTLNAYVSGLGSSKRVVVWDTTLAALTPDETLLVLGHETGHYALHHIPKQFALVELVLLVLFYGGFRAFKVLVQRFGPSTALEGEGDLASLPLALLLLTLLSFIGSPAFNAISRHYEHQADQYGLEVAYGVVPDPNAAAARAEQALGVLDLADPDPSPLIVLWLYTHPPVEDRIRFENTYHPWTEGRPMEFVHAKS